MSKINKKTFAEGLNDMFTQVLSEDNPQDAPSHLAPASTTRKRGAGSSKSFSNDLALFLQETIEDVVEEKGEIIKNEGLDAVTKNNTSKNRKPAIGLDALIRSTLEGGIAQESDKKRITFTFDKEKVDKLKQIADAEKARIRDIIEQLVLDYVEQYKLSK